MREQGSRICDHSATRDDCLRAWALPPELPPPPPAHANVESFFVYEVERGEPIGRTFLTDHQAAAVRAEDITVTNGSSRLRTTTDWVVCEASADAPPCLILGVDGEGRRGVCCAFEQATGAWRPLMGVLLPAATLLLAEVVVEQLPGVEGAEAGQECVHILDAAMICGDDLRRWPYAERRRRAELLVQALARDPAVAAQGPSEPAPYNPYAPPPSSQRRKGAAGHGAGADGGGAPPARDGVRVRLKPAYGLHQIDQAVHAGRARLEANAGAAVYPCRGLLMFPGHATPLLPLEPPADWTKEFSKSQQKEYYFNKVTGQSIWAHERKSRPISFRSSSAAMLRWDRRSGALPEAKLLELASEIPAPLAPPHA